MRYFGAHHPIFAAEFSKKCLKFGWQHWIQNTKYKLAPYLAGAELIAIGARWLVGRIDCNSIPIRPRGELVYKRG